MTPDVAPMSCPCCGRTLYLARRHEQAGRTVWVAAAGTPEVKSTAQGAYLTCQHCFKHIRVALVREGSEGTVLEVLREQDCR